MALFEISWSPMLLCKDAANVASRRHTGTVIIVTLRYATIVHTNACALILQRSANLVGYVDGTGHIGHASIAQTRPAFDARALVRDVIVDED